MGKYLTKYTRNSFNKTSQRKLLKDASKVAGGCKSLFLPGGKMCLASLFNHFKTFSLLKVSFEEEV